ncbi:MAG: (Fe-S)-binding protein [Thermomicrobiales bacterium]
MAIAVEADLKRLGGFFGEDVPEQDLLRACVHCGMCLPSCPTYRITGQEMSSPRGRLWLMNAVAEERLDLLDPVFDEQMYQCLNCRACEAVCPSGVHYGPLVEASRAQLEQHRPRPLWQRGARKATLGWLFADMKRFRFTVGALRLYQKTCVDRLMRRFGLLKLIKMHELDSMMPPIADSFLVPGRESWSPSTKRDSVMLFNGCVMSTVFADTNRATARVLAHNGATVTVPAAQQCCGALQVHSGQMVEARALARRNIEAFEAAGAETIIVNAAGCGAALKEYGYLFKDDPDYAGRAQRFVARVKDVTEYLGGIDLVPPTCVLDRTVTYQEPCHLAHAQRITEQPRKLLASIPGLELTEMRESSLCCGSAGIYNIIRREMANDLGDRKAENAKATNATEVITANPGCAMQLRASLRRNHYTMRVRHIVDLLDEAYGGEQAGQHHAWAVDQQS